MRTRAVLTHTAQAVAEGAFIALLVVGLAAGTTFAAKGGGGGGGHHGGGGTTSCTAKSPLVIVDNTWEWGQSGSFGLAGQRLTNAIDVINYDVGCGSSTFSLAVTAPSGFSVSLPAATIGLASGASGYLWAYITSPNVVADGDYPVTVTVTRSGTTSNTASTTTYFKVYSSDVVSPTLFWPNPSDATTISSGTYNFSVSSSDDHAVKSIDLYIDGAYRSTTLCDNISSVCDLYYS
jgi:hypothetical protein